MPYAVSIYVDAHENTYGASRTDQAGSRTMRTAGSPLEIYRTVDGHVVIYAGKWYPSQMSYQPFHRAVVAAAKRATISWP